MKTFIFSILFLISFSLACLAQINFPGMVINSQTWSAPPADTVTNEAGISLYTSATVNDSAKVAIISAQEVDMGPGFTAGAFSGRGWYDAKISTVATPISLLSPGPLENICPFEKMEIGVGISSGLTHLKAQIDSFIWHPRYPPYPTGVVNPFDPSEVSVVAMFSATDPYGHHKTYTRNGFYYQDVSVTNPHSATENYQVTDDQSYPFRIRFAPPFYGSWTVTVTITINNTQSYSSMPGSFYVTNCPQSQGFITTDQYSQNVNVKHNWHFMYDDNNYGSGATFFPIGQDLEGPVQHGYRGWNPPYSHELISNSDPSVIISGNDSMYWLSNFGMSNDDYDYKFHRNEIRNFANMGGNFVRMLMMWSGYGIDDGSPVICDFDPASSYELDSTLEVAESKNIYLLLAIESEQNVSDSNLYGFAETWGSKDRNPNMPHNTTYWNPYYDYLVNVEGLSNPDPSHFFSDANLIKYYKDKLRYIDARWGYSPNIFGYELFGEMDNVGYNTALPQNGEYRGEPANILGPISSWVDSMTTCVHSFYPSHLVTVGYAASPIWNYNGTGATDYSPEYIDFLDQHSYTSNLPEDSNRAPYFADKYFYDPQNYDKTVIEKPRIFGEEGIKCGNVEEDDGCSDEIVRHNDEWSAAFMTSGSGFYWADNFDQTSNMIDYTHIAAFFSYLSSIGLTFQNTRFSPITQYKTSYSHPGSEYYGWRRFIWLILPPNQITTIITRVLLRILNMKSGGWIM